MTTTPVYICIVLLISSFNLAVCDPLPEPPSPGEMSYDLEKKISLLQQEVGGDPEKQPGYKESDKFKDLKDYMKAQSEDPEKQIPASKESYKLDDLEKMEMKIQYFEKLIKKQEEEEQAVTQAESLDMPPCTGDECFDAELMQADALAHVTRYVGVGYNLLKGNPEGDFNRGGIDPGILVTKHIFEFSYDQGKQAYYRGSANNVPDQVQFHKFASCTSSSTLSAYSGEKSYQKQLSVSVEAEASYAGFSFGLSTGVESAKAGTEKQQKVNIDKEEICAYGRVRYLLENRNDAAFKVSTSFYNAIKRITAQGWSSSVYFDFLNQWGTHILVQADVGTRKISRAYLTYVETYKYLRNKNSVGISAGGSYGGFSGSFSVDISTMNEQADSSSQRNERTTTFSMGTEAEPLPVHMKLKSLADALSPEYWTNLPNGDTYESLRVAEKKTQLVRALREYPNYLRLNPLTDPAIIIPNAWPDGTFALQSSTSGCPSGWSEGWRYHDTEDSNSNNFWSGSLPNRIRGNYGKNNVKQYYCVKGGTAPNYGLEWPKGSYCIARKGGGCPTHFRTGYIHWDDEDSNNANGQFGSLPDGGYGRNTRIEYCCRNDERSHIPIILPKDKPFVLYRYGGTCQSVAGMRVADEYLRFDDEDSNNADSCSGARPDDDSCSNNHKIHYCYYY